MIWSSLEGGEPGGGGGPNHDTLPLQELYIHDSAGKEVFSDFVPQFVSAPAPEFQNHCSTKLVV